MAEPKLVPKFNLYFIKDHFRHCIWTNFEHIFFHEIFSRDLP